MTPVNIIMMLSLFIFSLLNIKFPFYSYSQECFYKNASHAFCLGILNPGDGSLIAGIDFKGNLESRSILSQIYCNLGHRF